MKILESQSAVLSNYEVLSHIQSARAQPRSAPSTNTNVETILKEITDYLAPPSTSHNPIPEDVAAAASTTTPTPNTNSNQIHTLLHRLQPYLLTKSETLMMLNLRPKDLTLLDCVVEECDDRLSVERQEEVLRVIGEVFGRGDSEMEGVNGNGNGNGNGEEHAEA